MKTRLGKAYRNKMRGIYVIALYLNGKGTLVNLSCGDFNGLESCINKMN